MEEIRSTSVESFHEGIAEFQQELAVHFQVPLRILFGGYDAQDTPEMEAYYATIAARDEEFFQPFIKLERSLKTGIAKARMRRYRSVRGIRRPKFARLHA